MAAMTGQHLAVGAGGIVGGGGIVSQLAGVLIGHGVDASLAYNEAGLAVTLLGLIGAGVWAIFKVKHPELVPGVTAELKTWEPDYAPMAAAMADEMERRAAATSTHTAAPAATQQAPAAPVVEPPAPAAVEPPASPT